MRSSAKLSAYWFFVIPYCVNLDDIAIFISEYADSLESPRFFYFHFVHSHREACMYLFIHPLLYLLLFLVSHFFVVEKVETEPFWSDIRALLLDMRAEDLMKGS